MVTLVTVFSVGYVLGLVRKVAVVTMCVLCEACIEEEEAQA
jgi:hypothetical protein